ncbi:hypothetical protein [Formosa sp. A9]|uniref:hypothetical protein n=1 Tax=Formosa sp. A9 TaxID=3442641 RepID=UPI003EBBAA5A
MENEFYTCKYCFEQFKPKRRRAQKYCSNTCRSKAYHSRKIKPSIVPVREDVKVPDMMPQPKQKVEAVSAPGVINSALGTAAVDGLKAVFTPEKQKHATKGDLDVLASKITGRYHLVKNMKALADGRKPFYDMETGQVVYLYVR